jgi:DNA helicase IV
MQWRMLGRRGRRASWTVVGDPAQAAWAGDPGELFRARDAALRGRRHRHLLTTNYRNSVEIFDLAASVIRRVAPDAQLPTAVRVTGIPPVTRTVLPGSLPESVRTAVAELLEQVEGTIGVITPEGRRDRVAGWLVGPDSRVQVVSALEAKGMEYDGVVLVEPAEVAQGSGARTLYVALSRATRRLTTLATTPWRT